MPAVPFKLNQDRRHHIPRQRHKVTNWPAYEASLRQRGSLTMWFTDDAIAAWAAEPRTTRGGQAWYSPLAILTAADHHPEAAVIVPPRRTAVLSEVASIAPKQRDRHPKCIAEKGRMGWQKA